MKLAGQLLLACVVLTALKAIAAVLVLTVGGTLFVGLILRPMETARAAGIIIGIFVFVGHPVLSSAAVVAIAVVTSVTNRKSERG